MTTTNDKHGYFVSGDGCEGLGHVVIAEGETEAIAIAWGNVFRDEGWDDIDNIECLPVPDANIDGLPVGMVKDERDALCRGLCDYLPDHECDECGAVADLTCYEGRALCEDCVWDAEHGDDDE